MYLGLFEEKENEKENKAFSLKNQLAQNNKNEVMCLVILEWENMVDE